MKIPVKQIIDILKNDIINIYGDPSGKDIDNLSDIEHTNETTLDWVNPTSENKQNIVECSLAKTIIVDNTIIYTEKVKSQNKVLIVVKNPKLSLAKVGNAFFVKKSFIGIHKTVYVDPMAEIGDNVNIAPYTVIGKVKIGNGCDIGANVRIYDDVIIGNNCRIKDGAIIGGEGFGFEYDENGNRMRFPQLGKVIIGDFVEIGANTCIDRGSLSNTIIENYVKIDNLCHIAHNVIIRSNAVVVACSEVSGSCEIGERTWIGPNSAIRDWRKIGSNALVGIGATVVKNIPDNEIWAGNPAKKFK